MYIEVPRNRGQNIPTKKSWTMKQSNKKVAILLTLKEAQFSYSVRRVSWFVLLSVYVLTRPASTQRLHTEEEDSTLCVLAEVCGNYTFLFVWPDSAQITQYTTRGLSPLALVRCHCVTMSGYVADLPDDLVTKKHSSHKKGPGKRCGF